MSLDKQSGADERLDNALKDIEACIRHFTNVPSTLDDTTARGNAHKAVATIRAALQAQPSAPANPNAMPSHIPAHAKKIGADTYGWQGDSNESMQELISNVASPYNPNATDGLFRSRVADLIHLLEFADIITPTNGDGIQAEKVMLDLKTMLATPADMPASDAGSGIHDFLLKLIAEPSNSEIRSSARLLYGWYMGGEFPDDAAPKECAIVPQVVQAPKQCGMHEKSWKYGLTKGPVMVLYVDSINDEQVCRDDLWLATTSQLAAPIVATVPSEQMEAEMWNRALEAAAMICDTSSLQPAIAVRIRALKHAALSPTEQASDVPCNKCGQIDVGQSGEYSCSVCGLPCLWDGKNNIVEIASDVPSSLPWEVVQVGDYSFDIVGHDEMGPITICSASESMAKFIVDACNKSAPAAKGNAPDEVKS